MLTTFVMDPSVQPDSSSSNNSSKPFPEATNNKNNVNVPEDQKETNGDFFEKAMTQTVSSFDVHSSSELQFSSQSNDNISAAANRNKDACTPFLQTNISPNEEVKWRSPELTPSSPSATPQTSSPNSPSKSETITSNSNSYNIKGEKSQVRGQPLVDHSALSNSGTPNRSSVDTEIERLLTESHLEFFNSVPSHLWKNIKSTNGTAEFIPNISEDFLHISDDQQRRELKALRARIMKENEMIKDQNKNLFFDNQRLEKQNTLLQQRVAFLERKLSETEKIVASYRQQISEYISNIQHLKTEIFEAKKLDTKYTLALEEKLQMEVELELWKRKYFKAEDQLKILQQIVRDRDDEIERLSKQLEEKESTITKLASKLISLKQQLDSIEITLCKYVVKKLHKVFSNIDAHLLIVQQHGTGEIRLDIIANGRRVSHPFSQIQNINSSSKNDCRFSITYKDGQTDIFESPTRDDILKQLYEYLRNPKQNENKS
jgi:hypothetical protein